MTAARRRSVPTPCGDGSFLQCNANLQRQVQCKNGDIHLGPTRVGAVISQIGACPAPAPLPGPTPARHRLRVERLHRHRCPIRLLHRHRSAPVQRPLLHRRPIRRLPRGNNPSGSIWWQDSGGTTTNVCNTCPTVHRKFACRCTSHINARTGKVGDGESRLGEVVGYQNECLPLPPKACGDQASGSTWWMNSGTQTAACETCWNGSQLTCTTIPNSRKVYRRCSLGDRSKSSRSLIGQNGVCPPSHAHVVMCLDGQTTWQIRSNGFDFVELVRTAPITCDRSFINRRCM